MEIKGPRDFFRLGGGLVNGSTWRLEVVVESKKNPLQTRKKGGMQQNMKRHFSKLCLPPSDRNPLDIFHALDMRSIRTL